MALRIYGNRQLKTLPGQATRPTTGRVREAVFNFWRNGITESLWLDLCAGNGVMGAEALCRGAAAVVGIEQSGAACRIIQHNWQQVAQPYQTFEVIRGDVRAWLPKLADRQFDYIYFDPPYYAGLYPAVLGAIAQYHLLAPQGELAVEYDPDAWDATTAPPEFSLRSQRCYGKTALALYAAIASSS